MIAPFHRRDTVTYALVTGAMAGTMVLLGSISSMGLQWSGEAWAVSAAFVAMLVPLAMGWRLPPDLPLHPVPADVAREALAPPPPGIARLRVALPPERFGPYRLDLYLDGVRLGQARSGAAVVLPLPLGQHALTLQVWLRRLGTTKLINALPGTDTDLLIRVSGGKSSQYSVQRQDIASALADRRIVVFGPPAPR